MSYKYTHTILRNTKQAISKVRYPFTYLQGGCPKAGYALEQAARKTHQTLRFLTVIYSQVHHDVQYT